MKPLVFIMPGNEAIGLEIIRRINGERANFILQYFPDGETYLRLLCEVKQKEIIIVCTTLEPNSKILPLYYLSCLLRDSDVRSICLVAPYLAYMRQDIAFKSGEAVSSKYFAKLISGIADRLITVDPHLHRYKSLTEIYSIPCSVVRSGFAIAEYVSHNISNHLLIGPDEESEQWISEIAEKAGSPYIILAKTRLGNEKVSLKFPDLLPYRNHCPVLIDDIISTAGSMMEIISHLSHSGLQAPICIGIHAVFAGKAFTNLKKAGALEIVTCNTIPHSSNRIDISDLIAQQIILPQEQ